MEEKKDTKKDTQVSSDSHFTIRMNYSKLYQTLFESVVGHSTTKAIDENNKPQLKLLKKIFKSMQDTITNKQEDVIQSVDVLEYFIKVVKDIRHIPLLKHVLKLLLEILKGDFIIKGERPFKSFNCVVFYLSNGFKYLGELLYELWLPPEIRVLARRRDNPKINLNSTHGHGSTDDYLHNEYGESKTPDLKHDNTYTGNVKGDINILPGLTKKSKSQSKKDADIDYGLFESINNILEYCNVVLNDLEIFQCPEIYTGFLRCYYNNLPYKVEESLLKTVYKIIIDKNHRISSGRYNAMYSRDYIKSFNNIF